MDLSVEDLIISERKFLHEISNHIVVAHGMSVSSLKRLEASNVEGLDPNIIDKLEKSLKAIEKLIASVKERRSTLHSRNNSVT